MVFLKVKRSEDEWFLMEFVSSSEMSLVINEIVRVWNERLRLRRLIEHIRSLAMHGPCKPVEQQGLEETLPAVVEEVGGSASSSSQAYVLPENAVFRKDPTAIRFGYGPPDDMKEMLEKTCDEAAAVLSQEFSDRKELLTFSLLEDKFLNLRGAVMIAYPQGLPEYDPVVEILSRNEDLSGRQASLEVYDPENASLWWAGKELFRDKSLGDFVGKNEKTTVVVKLQRKGSGPPVRESPLDKDTQKEMMAYWYKKQEEQKSLTEDDEDSYLNSTWADSASLKRHFQGLNNIGFRMR